MFYNGEEIVPEYDRWNNFNNPDAIKLAIVSSALWESYGWEVARVTTNGLADNQGFKFSGRLVEPVSRYPYSRWDLWHVLRDLAPCWFTTTDIINRGFDPSWAESMDQDLPKSVARNFTTACMYVTRSYCEQAIEIIKAYDQGKFSTILCDLVSDETILRYYGPRVERLDLMSHALAETGWKDQPLWHVPRSVLQHYAKEYPPAR